MMRIRRWTGGEAPAPGRRSTAIDQGGVPSMLRLRPVAFLATVVLVASACTGAGPSASAPAATAGGPTAAASQPAESQAAQPKTGGTLVVAIPGDLNRTDSALVDDANSTYVLQQI